MNWLDTAKALPVGRSTRVPHCKQDNSMQISHNEKGYFRYCHRCYDKEFEPHGVLSISAINRHKAEREYAEQRKPVLPKDYTTDIPRIEMLWFVKYGISPAVALKYQIGYSPSMERIVLPVYDEDGELEGVQLRATKDSQRPKYLNSCKMDDIVFTAGVSNGYTVIVEDILSAIKISKVAHATCILGTNMSDTRAYRIARKNNAAIIWLDGDKAGQTGATKAIKQLSLLGVTCYQIRTPKDPKEYSTAEIEEHIRNAQLC